MRFLNLSDPSDSASFEQAVRRGLGRGQGLYFPETIPVVTELDALLDLPFAERSALLLAELTGLDVAVIRPIVTAAFDFPLEQVAVDDRVNALELFHGPSLAFKDFGARFMAGCLSAFSDGSPTTILTATSGDTGAAVAHAFHNKPGVEAVILYPKGRITPLQEKLFCTLGGNIRTVAIEADFDTCQAMVKQAFDDETLRVQLGLNSANSINVARLLAQVCYYFESVARLQGREPVFCVPSGNFGNVTAGLVARAMGLPMKRMLAATNVNDTVPRYLADGQWAPRDTVATLSNAMDISRPNNFPRVEALAQRAGVPIAEFLDSVAVSDTDTTDAIVALKAKGYLADPHSALAWWALDASLADGEIGVFACTAHPAKFAEVILDATGEDVPLPPELAAVKDKTVLSATIPGDFSRLRELLLD
ncbi:threonine synthase [Marinihelvus fidelis]|uniref:Threonine synthase n=1 Tax=Marinihelvus fidelis TaxID=2613842 RepID=A0A5N0TAM0_9GAMM|nr:threonine synthase [Marinihelvus fidelis]KAA9131474.1 threonine synthase [Marinihelvus fidelis]